MTTLCSFRCYLGPTYVTCVDIVEEHGTATSHDANNSEASQHPKYKTMLIPGKSTRQQPTTMEFMLKQANTPNTRPEVDREHKLGGSTSVAWNNASTINIRDEDVVQIKNVSVRIFNLQ